MEIFSPRMTLEIYCVEMYCENFLWILWFYTVEGYDIKSFLGYKYSIKPIFYTVEKDHDWFYSKVNRGIFLMKLICT